MTLDQIRERLKRKRSHRHVPTGTIPKEFLPIDDQVDEKFIRANGRMIYVAFRFYKDYEVLVASEYVEHVDAATYCERKDSSRMNVFEKLCDP